MKEILENIPTEARYWVWADHESKANAALVRADTPLEAARNWMQQREFRDGETGDDHDLVTVVEDLPDALEDSYDVFCRLAYSASKREPA